MLLEVQDAQRFFRIHRALMFYVSQRLDAAPNELPQPVEVAPPSPELLLRARGALNGRLDLIESFVNENPACLSDDELDIIRSWRHLVVGKFYVFRDLKNYTVLLSATKPIIAYGVLALSQPFEELIGPHLPVLIETILLPFKDKIIYDGLMNGFRISFGPGIRRSLNESFKEAKSRHGIITSLPMSDLPLVPKKAPKSKGIPKPKSMEDPNEALGVIVGMIDQFCQEHLNQEYADLSRKLAEKLARKRPSPILSGSPNAWASGIVRTIGWLNFLHDKSQTPHMRLADIDAWFAISESAGAAKSAAIRKMFKLYPLDPNWTLPSRLDDNPMVWMLQVNGLTIDVRHAAREVQEMAFKKGLIPYIPADRKPKD